MISRLTFASPLLVLLFAGAPLSVCAQDAALASRVRRLEQDLGRAGQRLDMAQLYNRPPVDLDDEGAGPGRDPSSPSVRLDKLESQMRSLNGRIEELQHDISRLDEQLRASRDVSLAPERGGATLPPSSAASTLTAPATRPGASLGRGDAFDPSRDPSAAGAPRPLGATAPSAPLANPQRQPGVAGSSGAPAAAPLRESGAPLDLTHGRPGQDPFAPAPAPAAPTPAPAPGPAAALGGAPAAAPPPPTNEFDAAVASLRQRQYEAAEKGFSGFLAKNPASRLVPQATFNLGESFFLRGRHREAAEKYLEISTKYASSAQAPEAMLRLGQSLKAIGAKEQACASFSEIPIKYPNASALIKDAAQREAKKDEC
ncbi:MAG: tol-pal system protein YbgF [Methylocystis sp.]|nr:tol-pal system protein YbgF [Methylocystis sp.]